jgi:hypothetical protein
MGQLAVAKAGQTLGFDNGAAAFLCAALAVYL